MALTHKAAFQALLDYLIIWCFGLDSVLHREGPPHPTLSLCGLAFIQNQHPHWYLSWLYDTRLPGALFPLEVLSSSVFTAAGESAVYYLALASNNGTDSMSYILLFPSLWETALSSRL